MHYKYQVTIFTGSKVMAQTLNLAFDLEEWPWHYNVSTQNMRFHEIHLYTKYQMYISIGSKVMAILYIWPLTLKNDLDLIMLPIKMYSLVRFTCTPNIKCLSLFDQMMANVTYILTFDLEEWPWPWHIMCKMCNFMRYTFLPNIKSISVISQRSWPVLKLYDQNSIFDLWP